MKRYRWRSDRTPKPPPGVEIGRCYAVEQFQDEKGMKPNMLDLIGDDGSTVARHVPRYYLEECSESPRPE